MRWLFAALLLANAGYFAWEFGYRPADVQQLINTTAATSGDRLVLLSEASEGTPSSSAAGEAGATADSVTSPQSSTPPAKGPDIAAAACYRIGGIEKKTDADVLTAGLQQRGARLVGRGASQTTERNYWVMLPPFPSRDSAQRIVRELESHGVSDFYLVRGGEFENAISMGVFSTESAANRRVGQIGALALSSPPPRLDRIELTAKRFWVSVRWPADKAPMDWRAQVPDHPEITIGRIACGGSR